MKITYDRAHLIIATKLKQKLDKIITEVMIEVSGDDTMTICDRLELIDALPSEADRLINTIDGSIEYHQERLDREEEIAKKGGNDEE